MNARKRLRVLHLLTALGHGGAEVWLLNLIEPLRAEGIDVGFVLKAPELGKLRHVAEQRGAATHVVRLDPTLARYAWGVARIAKRDDYDVIHTHEFVHSAPGVLAAKLASLPSVVTFHHFTFEPQTPLTRRPGLRQLREAYGKLGVRWTVANADRVTTLSSAVMARVVPNHARMEKCRVLHLSVAGLPRADAKRRAELRRELGFPADARIVLHAGRFIEQKNHAGVLRVFRKVLARLPDAHLALLGQGPLQEQVLSSASDLVAAGKARFLGVRDDMLALMAAADVLLFPSLHEGFGLVALEANACGLPVVGTRVPGLVEAVVDGETALLHDVSDEDGMASSVIELLTNERRADELARRGAERARAEFSHEASARALAAVYRELVA